MPQRLAETGGLELRIFNRDGVKRARAVSPIRRQSPNADIVNEFLREQDGRTYQSVPVAAFFTKDFGHLYQYIERPIVHHARRPRIVAAMQVPRPGEDRDRAWARFMDDWRGLRELDVAAGVGVGDGRRGALRAPRAHRDGTARPNLISRRRPIMSMRKLGRTGLRVPSSAWAATPLTGPSTRRPRRPCWTPTSRRAVTSSTPPTCTRAGCPVAPAQVQPGLPRRRVAHRPSRAAGTTPRLSLPSA